MEKRSIYYVQYQTERNIKTRTITSPAYGTHPVMDMIVIILVQITTFSDLRSLYKRSQNLQS